jgi:uncharacterized protein YndB with AHSA1/START domain
VSDGRKDAADREVRIVHVFDAPREAVFGAWTDPDQVARWWSPDQFEIPRESVTIEPEIGGRFHLTMVEAAGEARHPYRAEFVEISSPELIVLRAEAIPDAGIPEPTVTRISFEAIGGRTRVTIVAGPYTDEMRGNAEAGLLDILANLEALLQRDHADAERPGQGESQR